MHTSIVKVTVNVYNDFNEILLGVIFEEGHRLFFGVIADKHAGKAVRKS